MGLSLSSPQRRSQNPCSPLSSSFRRQLSGRSEWGGWSVLIQRHRFLLTMLALLAFLCTIYLYFAVTLGATESCSEMTGAEKALCQLEKAKSSISHHGKGQARKPEGEGGGSSVRPRKIHPHSVKYLQERGNAGSW